MDVDLTCNVVKRISNTITSILSKYIENVVSLRHFIIYEKKRKEKKSQSVIEWNMSCYYPMIDHYKKCERKKN